ncbi:MAG: ribulose-phosphate 3-epimerase, partial [Candidatus Dormibacteraceae bacterium]
MTGNKRGSRHQIKIIPSILSADLASLGQQVEAAAAGGADRIQVDVMDGHFVPGLTFGPDIVAALHRVIPELPIEAHLMVEQPDLFVQAFARAGATVIQVQVEAPKLLYRTVQRIKDLNVKAGVAINPATSVEALREIAPYIDMVNVMTVEPGFGGQSFIPH